MDYLVIAYSATLVTATSYSCYLRSGVQTKGQWFCLGDDAPHSLLCLSVVAVEQEALHQAASRRRHRLQLGREDDGGARLCASQRIGLSLLSNSGALKKTHVAVSALGERDRLLYQPVDELKAEETCLQRASLLPVRPLPFLVGQHEVAGFAHFVELVTVVLQSHFVVRALPAHHLENTKRSRRRPSGQVEVLSGRLVATHEAAGPAVVSSPGEGVEGLLALHADRYLIVPDPARGTAAEFLCL